MSEALKEYKVAAINCEPKMFEKENNLKKQYALVEEAAKNKQTSKIDSLKEEQKKLIAEKKEIQKQDGNFTFSQGTRYAAINSRWGIAIGSLSATKGLKSTTEKLDKFLEENTQDMQDSQNSSEDLRSKTT